MSGYFVNVYRRHNRLTLGLGGVFGAAVALWVLDESRAAARARAALHHDALHTLVKSQPREAPLEAGAIGGFQGVAALRMWLVDVSWSPAQVWRIGFEDFHPALHLVLVHLLRAAGASFETSFLTVNFSALLLLVVGAVLVNRLDRRTMLSGLIVVLVVLVSPAVLRTASEPRHWMLATAFSLLGVVTLSWIFRCSLAGRVLRFREVALCALTLVGGLLTETTLGVGLIAWVLVVIVTVRRSTSSSALVRNATRTVALSALLWLLLFPQGVSLFVRAVGWRGGELFSGQTTPALSSRLQPGFDVDQARRYLSGLGDLWQIGGDGRVTFVLLWGSLLFLFVVQLGVVLVRCGVWSGLGWFDFRVVTHGFVVGLVGSVWAALYLVLYSFGFLPDHAAGWKYMLPHGVLLLVGVWDGVQRGPWRLVGGGLVVAVLLYHSSVLSLDRNGQAGLVERLAASDRVLVFGNKLDLLQVMYPLAAGEFDAVPEVYFAGQGGAVEHLVCEGDELWGEVFVTARREPFALGVEAALTASTARPKLDLLGDVEWQEIGVITSC